MTSHPWHTSEDPDIAKIADLLRLMSNPNRLAILQRLCAGEVSVSEMELDLRIRQPTLSQQLAELRKAGLVRDRREAKSVFYRLVDGRVSALIAHLRELFAENPAAAALPTRPTRKPQDPATKAPPAQAAVYGRILITPRKIRTTV